MHDSPAEGLAAVPFWYLRHGETDWNAQGLSQGNVDIPLNAVGVAQAKAAALLMRDRGVATIIASPLSRARVTAEIVAEVLGLPLTIDPDLREASWGVAEGKPMSEWFHGWIAGGPAPEGAETLGELRHRVVRGLNRALACPPTVLIVAHGAVFRAVRSAMGVSANMRTRNASPIRCEPPKAPGATWSLDYLDNA